MRSPAGFMIVVSTIGMRLGIVPRRVVMSGYGAALVLILNVSYVELLILVFPAWVAAVSDVILLRPALQPAGKAWSGEAGTPSHSWDVGRRLRVLASMHPFGCRSTRGIRDRRRRARQSNRLLGRDQAAERSTRTASGDRCACLRRSGLTGCVGDGANDKAANVAATAT